MKIKKTILFLTLIILIPSLAGLSRAKDIQEGLPLSQVPKKVINAAKKEVAGIRLLDAKIITKDDGQIVYLLDGAVGQNAYEVMVDSNGDILGGDSGKGIESEVPISRVPGNILLAARKEVSGLKVIKAKIIEGKDVEKIYEIEGVMKNKTYRIRISLSAEIIESEIVDKYLEK
ncbi:MAG: hypothetical protein L6416_05630 [Candidatus Omnitrophica bacterium]|nr:hypothetical protein [Candidatus Omnitrophota bacterium]